MIKENFDLLISLTEAASKTAGTVMVDLVGVWMGTGQTEVMKFIDPKDTFRGMCMWLGANAVDTNTLAFVNGMMPGYLGFYADYIKDAGDLCMDNMNNVLVDMLKNYRETAFSS